jgi:hypothetical protein
LNHYACALFSVVLSVLPATSLFAQESNKDGPVRLSDPFASIDRTLSQQFHFSAGVRYWYSSGRINFAFANQQPRFGDPTSTLDWTGTTAHSGEAFMRLDHTPTGLFLKGIGGGGGITNGDLVDRDFVAGQRSFSAFRIPVTGSGLSYGIIDIGIQFTPAPQAAPGLKVWPFLGYHFWYDNPISRGGTCEPTDIPNAFCRTSATGVLASPSTKVIGYAARWNALRLGIGASTPIPVVAGLSISTEVAWVPYARSEVDDSHYLRTDLGSPPNIFLRSKGSGVEAEVMLSYAVTERFGLGLGGRYWGLFSDGDVRFQPSPSRYPVSRYDQQRYGMLLQAKYSF